MSVDKPIQIPRHAGAGVSFAGADIEDAWLVIAGVFLGIFVGGFLHAGTPAFVGFPLGSFILNKMFLDWKTSGMPGHFRATLYRLGLSGYSEGFPMQDMVYVGDAQPGNLDSRRLVDAAMQRVVAAQEGRLRAPREVRIVRSAAEEV